MSVTNLTGGISPGDPADPRTFPAIWNDKNIPSFGTATPSDGDALVYDDASDRWVPGEGGAGSLEDLTDTDIASPADGEVLTYDGADWVNESLPDATTTSPGVVTGTTSDGDNTALGDQALRSNTTGIKNTAMGYRALQDNTLGRDNVALGANCLNENISGGFNVALGFAALLRNTTGQLNMAIGQRALQDNIDGDDNVAVGKSALQRSTDRGNVAIGTKAGEDLVSGSNNLILGDDAQASTTTVSNEITLGNSSHTTIRAQVTSITALSDVRDKTDIVETQHGLEIIKKLRPVNFTWDTRDGTITDRSDIGFIAQDLAALEDELGERERLRLTLRENPEKLEATPGRLIPILVKAVQDLSAQNEELLARIETLENK